MNRKFRLGMYSINPDEIRILKKYGYDTYEGHFRLIREMPEREFEALLAVTKETGVCGEGTNCFADPPMKLLTASYDELDEYLESGLVRPLQLGAKYVVIGSGAARAIPEGMGREEAVEKFTTMLSRYGKIAARYDVDIVVEPLFKKGCNFINTFAEGLEICRAVNHPRVGLLMDFFHSYQEGEPFSVMAQAGAYLKHIHLSTLDRRTPGRNDVDETKMLVQILKDIDYRGRIALEGDIRTDFETEMREFSELFYLLE